MHDSADRLDFAPPPQPAAVRAFLLAILAHLLLILALTWGINWDRDSQDVAAEAELWSGVPQQQPEPKVEPKVVQAPPLPAPPPQPVPKVETPPAPPVTKEPDIALEQEKKRRELAERRKEEQEREKKLEAARKKREELELEKKQEARKREEEQKRQAVAEQKALEEKKKKEEQAKAAKEKAREQAEAKQAQANREANLARMRSLAGTGPADNDNGSSSAGGPSTSYAAKIAARIRPHIRHPQDVPGNPPVIIEVRTSPDGTIVGQRVVKSSGNSAWDESAIRAIIATGSLPRDIDGRMHSPIEVSVRQRD
jgi:colicin import membrane protein